MYYKNERYINTLTFTFFTFITHDKLVTYTCFIKQPLSFSYVTLRRINQFEQNFQVP